MSVIHLIDFSHQTCTSSYKHKWSSFTPCKVPSTLKVSNFKFYFRKVKKNIKLQQPNLKRKPHCIQHMNHKRKVSRLVLNIHKFKSGSNLILRPELNFNPLTENKNWFTISPSVHLNLNISFLSEVLALENFANSKSNAIQELCHRKIIQGLSSYTRMIVI